MRRLTIRLFVLALAIKVCALAADGRSWQTGKVARAEQSKRDKPNHEIWNPWLTHWYTIENASQLIEATEMVPPRTRGRAPGTPMSFGVGETVKFAIGEVPADSSTPRSLFVVDRKGKEHILTIDQITPTGNWNPPKPIP